MQLQEQLKEFLNKKATLNREQGTSEERPVPWFLLDKIGGSEFPTLIEMEHFNQWHAPTPLVIAQTICTDGVPRSPFPVKSSLLRAFPD